MKIEKLHESITLLTFPTQEELCTTFMRFQEHYESPMFRNKVFTIGQFKEWYSKDKGAFTYNKDWSGMNIPSYVFDAFKQGLFDPLTEKEQELLDLFKYRTDKFYVIGSVEGDASTKGHEISHALYYTNIDYKDEAIAIMNNIPRATFMEFRDKLKALGYCDEVIADEIHAYCSEGAEDLKVRPGVEVDPAICQAISDLRKKYFISPLDK